MSAEYLPVTRGCAYAEFFQLRETFFMKNI